VVEKVVAGHMANCAIHGEGPCTCGAEEFLEELVFEEAGLTEEDFQ